MRTPMIAGNWKMNTTISEAVELVRGICAGANSISGIEKVVCPPFISLAEVKKALSGSAIKVGAQNVYFEDKGAYTGEISPMMLVGLCEYVIIGHSERRQYFQEDGGIVSKKIRAALKHSLKPILCIGENLGEYEAGRTKDVVTWQLKSSLEGVDQADSISIAYEPVWAIGTGRAATGVQANETIRLIRSLVAEKYGSTIAGNMRILYGGSVTAANIAEFVSQPDIDGALVGGASLKAAEFISIIKTTSDLRR